MATPPAVLSLSIPSTEPDTADTRRPLTGGLGELRLHVIVERLRRESETMMRLEITVPRECVDGVSFTLMGRRARVEAEEVRGATHIMHVQMAMADMVGFADELRVRTQGRASYFDRASCKRS